MRIVLQRCSKAEVAVAGQVVGRLLGPGFVLLVGIAKTDTDEDGAYLAEKIRGLRVFADGDGKMNHSIVDVGGGVLSISQFTLYGDVRKGRRPNYLDAAPPNLAQPLYEAFNAALRARGLHVQTGIFGAMMEVTLSNDGPVTILLDSQR